MLGYGSLLFVDVCPSSSLSVAVCLLCVGACLMVGVSSLLCFLVDSCFDRVVRCVLFVVCPLRCFLCVVCSSLRYVCSVLFSAWCLSCVVVRDVLVGV